MSATEPLRATDPTTPPALDSLFEQFVQRGRYLRNWTPKTEQSYRQAHRSLSTTLANRPTVGTRLTKEVVQSWIVGLRQRGLAAGACNAYLRAINSFSSWPLTERHIDVSARVPALREPRRIVETFSDQQVSALIRFRPASLPQRRLSTLLKGLPCATVDDD